MKVEDGESKEPSPMRDGSFVGAARFELTTSCSQSRRDTGLRYAPKKRPDDRALAERGGFEPPVQFNPYGSLANYWFKPLTHLSKVSRHGRRGGKYSQLALSRVIHDQFRRFQGTPKA